MTTTKAKPLGDEVEHWLRYLNAEQIDALLRPIKEQRVGRDQKGLSHVEAYEIRAHLNRIFGFCRWSAECLAMEFIAERPSVNSKGQDAVTVAYRAQMRLAVHAPDGTLLAVYTEWATGDAPNFPPTQWPDAHDFAIKTAESQAFKRCAVNLGDQFGLSLYRKGSLSPLVKVTLVHPPGEAEHPKADVQDVAPATFRAPDPEPQGEPEPEPEPAEETGSPESATMTADGYRDAILAATTRADVIPLLRGLELHTKENPQGLGGVMVGDADGVLIALRVLAAKTMKALTPE